MDLGILYYLCVLSDWYMHVQISKSHFDSMLSVGPVAPIYPNQFLLLEGPGTSLVRVLVSSS